MNTVLQSMRRVVPIAALLLLAASCVDGYKEESTWESTVSGKQLENPEVTVSASPDGTEVIVNWSVVLGAGGYDVELYNVDDPDNEVLLVKKEKFDGFELRWPATDDTKYRAEVKTRENDAKNNTAPTEGVAKAWDNLLPVYEIIPSGSNLTEYFAANPIPASETELCYELEAGGDYTMNGSITFASSDVTIRGAKTDHAKIALTDGSFISEGPKVKLQFMDIDARNFTGAIGASGNALFLMSPNFPTEGLTENGYKIVPGFTLQSCKVVGLPNYIFFDNSKKWAITTLMIKDCIVGQNNSTLGAALIRCNNNSGMIQNLTLSNSTFYNVNPPESEINQRFIQVSTGTVASVGGSWLPGSAVLSVTNCTFYKFVYGQQFGNSNNAFRNGNDKVIIQRNVFIDSGKNSNNMREFRIRNTNNFTGGQNSQWWNGEDLYLRSGSNEASNDVNPINGDPGTANIDATTQEITVNMTGAAQLTARTGDPRWLPQE